MNGKTAKLLRKYVRELAEEQGASDDQRNDLQRKEKQKWLQANWVERTKMRKKMVAKLASVEDSGAESESESDAE